MFQTPTDPSHHPSNTPPTHHSEASLRTMERELSATVQEKEELRALLHASESGQSHEARVLREQLATEKRCVVLRCIGCC